MENASKALLMAGGILIGILLLSLMVTLFASSSSLSKSYDEAKQEEAIQQFNSNFIKYLGKDLTIHEVVTICNFAVKNNVIVNQEYTVDQIKIDVDKYEKDDNGDSIQKYELMVAEYNDNGYIKKIIINKK